MAGCRRGALRMVLAISISSSSPKTGKSQQKANANQKPFGPWNLPSGFFGKYSMSTYSKAVGAAAHVWFKQGPSGNQDRTTGKGPYPWAHCLCLTEAFGYWKELYATRVQEHIRPFFPAYRRPVPIWSNLQYSFYS